MNPSLCNAFGGSRSAQLSVTSVRARRGSGHSLFLLRSFDPAVSRCLRSRGRLLGSERWAVGALPGFWKIVTRSTRAARNCLATAEPARRDASESRREEVAVGSSLPHSPGHKSVRPLPQGLIDPALDSICIDAVRA